MLKDLVLKSRSFRRFYEDVQISDELLLDLVDMARVTPSARNDQPLKYLVISTSEMKNKIFPNLAWAGYLKDWNGPSEGERPSAYIVVLGDTNIKKSFDVDLGIASQTILLGACEMGFGGCMIGAFNREKVKNLLDIDETLEPLLVLALGKPKETVVIDEIKDNDVKYWRDSNSIHHVPKRSFNEILIKKL